MNEEVVFRYFARDFFKDPNDPKIFIMMSALFRDAVIGIVEKACGDRMKHPQVEIAYNDPELTFIVPPDARNIFLRTFNAEIAPAITHYLSTITI